MGFLHARLRLLLLFYVLTPVVSGQEGIRADLRNRVVNAGSPQQMAALLQKLAEETASADSILAYVAWVGKLGREANDEFIRDQADGLKGFYHARLNQTDSALLIIDPLVKKYKSRPDHQEAYLRLLFFRAKLFDRSGQYSRAIGELAAVTDEARLQRDTLIEIQAKTGIGWIQMELEQYRDALHWLQDALHTSANPAFYANYGALYSNLASCYNALGKHDSALHFIRVAIEDARQYNNLLFLATALSMQARIYIDAGDPLLAEQPLHEVVEIRKKLNDPFYVVFDMSNLAGYYAVNRHPEKGIALCKEGIQLARRLGLSSQLLMIYRSLAENYKAADDSRRYSETLEEIIRLKDSFNTINTSKQLSVLQSANEAEKRERRIVEQRLELTRKNYWISGAVIFILMAGGMAWLIFQSYRKKQRLHMRLALEEEKRLAATAVAEAEEQERKRIAADLHDNIGAYASAISADVDKIAGISGMVEIPSFLNLRNHSHEIINSLRDTIWVLNKEGITVTSVGDRIKNYIVKLQPSYPEIRINFREEVEEDTKISSRRALSLFRILQEAVHNALRHSQARNMVISLNGSRESFWIEVADDGVGIENVTGNRGGTGLYNMKQRAAEAGFLLQIEGGRNGGTVVTIAFAHPSTQE